MARKFAKLFPLLALSALLLLALSFPAPANAQLFSIGDIGAKVIGTVLSSLGYIITFVAGIGVAVLSWAISVVLEISLRAINNPAIQSGYGVTLSIANLGFVLGVIIVAIATILRNQTYGIKTLLYRIVVMAVLVNFGLILAGGLINVSNGLTQYFLDAITGGKGAESISRFSKTMTATFNPQSLLVPYKATDTENPELTKEYANTSAGSEFQKILQPIAGFFMLIVAMVMIIITLAAFLIMLIIRYVYLVLLLVLLPLAWMSWAFPYLEEHFKSWWKKFIQQILFPPAALFFLWLAIRVNKAMFAATPKITGDSGLNAIGSLLAALAEPVLQIVFQAALMAGGLMAAEKLGVSFADTGMKWAQGAKDWTLKRAGRVAKRGISAPFQGEGVQRKAQEMMRGGNYFQRLMGRAVTMAARPGGVSQVADYEKQYGGLNKQQLLEELRADPLGHNKNSRAAILNLLNKQGGLGELTPDEIKTYVAGEKNEAIFRQIGQNKTRDEILDASGFNAQTHAAKISELKNQLGSAGDERTRRQMQESIDASLLALQKSIAKISPETLAGFFKKAGGAGQNPLGMENDAFNNFKKTIAEAMARPGAITVSKYSSFISNLQEKGGAQGESAFIEANKDIKSADLSDGIKKWLDNTGSRNFGIDRSRYYPRDESAFRERVAAAGLTAPTAEEVSAFGTPTNRTPEAGGEGKGPGLVDESGRPLGTSAK
jgi:hypothetical protein